MEKNRLNNFILWCKGWYQPIKTDMDFIVQAQKSLVLDGYMPCNNPISISLNFIDELVEKKIEMYSLRLDGLRKAGLGDEENRILCMLKEILKEKRI